MSVHINLTGPKTYWVLHITTAEYHDMVWLFSSEQRARKCLENYVAEWWGQELDEDAGTPSDYPDKGVGRYFDESGESYMIKPVLLDKD